MDSGGPSLTFFIVLQVIFVLVVGGCVVLLVCAMVRARRRKEEERLGEADAIWSSDPENPFSTRDRLSGMTLRERLAALDVQSDWDRALTAHDRTALILTLRRVRLSEHDAARTADAILRDPGRYGY